MSERSQSKPVPAAGNSNRQGIQVIARAAGILRALESRPEGMSLGELAKEMNLARSTIQRIVGALIDERLLIAASPRARVRLGPGLLSLGSAAKFDLGQLVHPYLEQLSDEVGETVDLSIMDGHNVVFIDQVTNRDQRLQAVSAIGAAFPLHTCAPGKALLALMDKEPLKSYINDSGLPKHTKNTITSPEKLRVELRKVRKNRIAYDIEEHTEGICAVGAHLHDLSNRNMAISIPVPTVRFHAKQKTLAGALMEYLAVIERTLGEAICDNN